MALKWRTKSPLEEVEQKIEQEDYDIVKKLESIREQILEFHNQEEGIYNNLDLRRKREKEVPDIEIFLEEESEKFESIKGELVDLNQKIDEAGNESEKLMQILQDEDLTQETVAKTIKAIEKIEAEINSFENKLEESDEDPDKLLSQFTEKVNNQIEKLESHLEI